MSYQQEMEKLITSLEDDVYEKQKENKMKDTINNAVITKDKQSSIEVNRNAKGDYAFKVKTYYDPDDNAAETIVQLNQDIMNDLIGKFS